MSKRKRIEEEPASDMALPETKRRETTSKGDISIQIVAGSYERSLHGIMATISDVSQGAPHGDKAAAEEPTVAFADSFLFNAHSSAIRCLALSPKPSASSSQKTVFLASGGTDERVNVYSLSTSPATEEEKLPMPSLGGNKISENPRNRELGTLMHHSSSITALYFPTRAKLLSAAADNAISFTRTKDLTTVSTIKAPRPKILGRPSGDTAPPGDAPVGVNDFAVHPSMKLMITVGKGERCMRLWNLVTGKKAGVLNFGREILQQVQEGKYSTGEGRKVAWNPTRNEFVVGFERGAVVFGEDSKPRTRILPSPLTKLHQMKYFTVGDGALEMTFLAISTERGQILFYPAGDDHDAAGAEADPGKLQDELCVAELVSPSGDPGGRIKDFEVLDLSHSQNPGLVIVTAGSDGRVRLWNVDVNRLRTAWDNRHPKPDALPVAQIARLLGSYETGSRITCLRAFVMDEADEEVDSEFEGFTENSAESLSSSEENGDY